MPRRSAQATIDPRSPEGDIGFVEVGDARFPFALSEAREGKPIFCFWGSGDSGAIMATRLRLERWGRERGLPTDVRYGAPLV